MTLLNDIAAGLELLLGFEALIYLLIGLVAGFIAGVLPGFSSTSAAAVILPFSIGLSTEVALILMVAIYAGASFAGSVPAILLNVPGTPSAAATAIDGYPMARKGNAEFAIGIARMSSLLGGLIGGLVVLVTIRPISSIALSLGAREIFFITVMGLAAVGTLTRGNRYKGILAVLLGVIIASMSASPQSAVSRFSLGFPELYESVPIIPAIIGLFGISQMLIIARHEWLVDSNVSNSEVRLGKSFLSRVLSGIRFPLSYPILVTRSATIGVLVGAVPGIGTAVGSFLSYGVAKQRSKEPERFGRGAPEGVVAAEACDNAVTGGTLVPTLTLGIPGSGMAAIMMGSLYLHGVAPGPRIMTGHTAEVYAVFLSLLLASMLILPLGILLAAPMSRIMEVPPRILVPLVLMLCVVGSFALRTSVFDAALALVFGVLGVLLRVYGYPVVPLVIALILAPVMEVNLIRALALGQNDLGYMLGSPLAVTLFATAVAILTVPAIPTIFRKLSEWLGRNGEARERNR